MAQAVEMEEEYRIYDEHDQENGHENLYADHDDLTRSDDSKCGTEGRQFFKVGAILFIVVAFAVTLALVLPPELKPISPGPTTSVAANYSRGNYYSSNFRGDNLGGDTGSNLGGDASSNLGGDTSSLTGFINRADLICFFWWWSRSCRSINNVWAWVPTVGNCHNMIASSCVNNSYL
jgi:hypothetical protein